ncbi:unnamed protein product [Cylindrotheca closterium]|uniref:Uncharacterized protein n=1 Tax=Cylindrotheca closterium TaxID=2856 RepID=A0AAD2PWW1_9STRA|nr:unnamed protein product [Cylindrotheca closterium]
MELVSLPALRVYWSSKDRLSKQSIREVDWISLARAMKALPANLQRWTPKHIFGMTGVGKFLAIWNRSTKSSCPRCSSCPVEDHLHVPRCSAPTAAAEWSKRHLAFRTWMQTQQTAPEIEAFEYLKTVRQPSLGVPNVRACEDDTDFLFEDMDSELDFEEMLSGDDLFTKIAAMADRKQVDLEDLPTAERTLQATTQNDRMLRYKRINQYFFMDTFLAAKNGGRSTRSGTNSTPAPTTGAANQPVSPATPTVGNTAGTPANATVPPGLLLQALKRGKVAKICPFDASAFLGLLDNDDSDADDEEDNIKIHGQKANWDIYYFRSHFVQKEQAKMVQSCPFFAPFLGIPDDSDGAIKSVSDDEEDKAIRKVSSARAPSPMDLQGAVEDKPFQHYADKF